MKAKGMSATGRRRRAGWCACGSTTGAVLFGLVAGVVLLAIMSFRPFGRREGGPSERTAAPEVEMANLRAALGAFKDATGRYPTTEEGLRLLVERQMNYPGGRTAPLLRRIPPDPWGNAYQYACPGAHNCKGYDLYSFGPDGKPGTGDDITNWGAPPARK